MSDATHNKTDFAREARAKVRGFLAEKLAQVKKNNKDFRPGDLVCVSTLVKEKDKERLQKFEGRCIARRGSGLDATYTLWSVVQEVGVKRTFPLHAYDLEVIRRGRVRRAKLNYFTKLRGKKARIKEIKR